jgi:DNA-directed RNA polymerase specialized sigma24 family protein
MGTPPDEERPMAPALPWTLTGRDAFPNTRWTLVIAAGSDQTDVERGAALESLCRGYWYPVYAFIRRRGNSPEDAQDLTQEFFLRVLSGSFFARASAEKGRFRGFLLGAVKNFLADSHDRDKALKRGGGVAPLPFDFATGESVYMREPGHNETPERIFQRKWARSLLDRVLFGLQDEFLRGGKLDHFNRLRGVLAGSGEVKYADLARELGIGEAALKSAIQRLRKRHRELLRAEVAATVADPAEVDEELRFLLQAISTRSQEVE